MISDKNIEYLIENIAKFSSIPYNTGITRESFTKEYRGAVEFLKQYMKDIGLAVREDGIGTVFGRLEGTDSNSKVIMSGSHLDSVHEGGKYDGISGIVTAIEALNKIKTSGKKHTHPIEAVIMTEEEGCRFLSSLFSSRAMTGMVTDSEINSIKDDNGVILAEAIVKYGVSGNLSECIRDDIKCFVELHIEQGPILENEDKDIGVVTSIVALRAYNIRISGSAGHAGTTPMNMRRDPLAASGEIIAKLYNMALDFGHSLVLTVGKISAKPSSANVIPYEVEFTIDLRNPDEKYVDTAEDKMNEIVKEICGKYNTEYEISCAFSKKSAKMDAGIMKSIRHFSKEHNCSYMDIPSGAGHDSQIMAKKVPTGMIFIPSKGGRSHCKEEFTSLEHLKKGAMVLSDVLYDLAKGE